MVEEEANAPRRLGRTPQLLELRDPDDDWTGVTKTSDRRRRQNRLNQRAYRRRQLAQSDSPDNGHQVASSSDGYLMIEDPRIRGVTQAFMQLAHMQYLLRKPRLVYLPSLIRLNAINALSHNALLLGIPVEGLCADELISPFNALGPKMPEGTPPPTENCPENLLPTPLQVAVEHHPWTDLLPAPRLRDNVLNGITTGEVDEDVLCCDLLDVVTSQQRDDAYLIVWGDPSDVYGWEVSVGFLRKWGWLLRGCPELIESTNRWRMKRGEARLNIEV
ncbi:hypothetical protein ACJ41O_014179 [Fusarium nematophilum]